MAKHKKNYYAVARGLKPGIYEKWAGEGGAEQQIKGYNGARYKGFYALEDAVAWLEEEGVPASKKYRDQIKMESQPDADTVVIYTDGSTLNNPGPGGYAAVLMYQGHRKELSGGFRRTTNNRMELMACIQALLALKDKTNAILYCDSKYIVDSITQGWARKWQAQRWKKKNKDPVQNPDLWQQLLKMLDRHNVEMKWVKGHGGKKENERCDELAVQAAQQNNLPPDKGYEKNQSDSLFS